MDYYEPFDPEYARRVIGELFDPALEHYFRPRLLHADRIPREGPAILVANHSGNAFPFDGIVLDSVLWRREGMPETHRIRSLFEKELALTWWMRPFGLDNFWRRCGGVDITFDNFDRVLRRGERTIYYPEGVPGIGKGFHKRYQLQPFHTSFVVLAARHRAPVVPVYVVNAEWLVPFSFTLRPIDRIMQKLFHVPFLPLPAAPLAMVFPWAWWMSLPARMVFIVGEPIDVAALARGRALDLEAPGGHERAQELADDVRRIMQADLHRHVRRYGKWPYQLRSLAREARRAWRRGRLWRALPTGWTSSFVRFGRDSAGGGNASSRRRRMRDWDLAAFYVPFGWPLLTLIRRLRRPPCGYRGLSAAERGRREGRFVWRLRERPLPPREAERTG